MWEPVFKNVGKELSKRVFFGNHADSWEAGWHNWTALMPAEFEQRNGYDIISYLPAITGRLLENQATAEGFLWDFKRTISEMGKNNFFVDKNSALSTIYKRLDQSECLNCDIRSFIECKNEKANEY